MAVFELTEAVVFPDPELAEPYGLLAIGGDLFYMHVYPYITSFSQLFSCLSLLFLTLSPLEQNGQHGQQLVTQH